MLWVYISFEFCYYQDKIIGKYIKILENNFFKYYINIGLFKEEEMSSKEVVYILIIIYCLCNKKLVLELRLRFFFVKFKRV